MNPFCADERVGKHLIYHIDEGLGVAPTQASNHFSFIAVGEDGCNQGDAFIRGKGAIDQLFPRWNAATREKLVRPVNVRFQNRNSQAAQDVQHLWT